MNLSDYRPGGALDLSGRRIFLSGGTGFLGRTLLDLLGEAQANHALDCQVTVLSRDPDAFHQRHPQYRRQPWLELIAGSLDNLPAEGRQFTDVIHAAADTHAEGKGAEWIGQIIGGTKAMLDFAVRSGAQRFLLTSSGAVYGPQPDDVAELDERYPGAPPTNSINSTYGQAKRVAEQLCTIYHHEHGLQTVSARCFAFAGRHLPLNGPYAFGNFLRDALAGTDIRVKGDGTTVRSYLDGADMAHWLLSLLIQGAPGEAYNVGSNVPVTMAELASKIAQLLAQGSEVRVENTAAPQFARSRYIPSIQKAQALGLTPQFSLDEIILRTAAGLSRSPSRPLAGSDSCVARFTT